MLRSFTPLRGIFLALGLIAAQACSQRPADQPAPMGNSAGAGLSIDEARAWYQAAYADSSSVALPGPQLPATATATGTTSSSGAPAALVWGRALTVGTGSQQLVLVPLAGDQALFANRPYAGSRYLIVARTSTNALDGSLVEVLLRRTPAPLDTLALFTNLYRSYRSGHLAAPGTGEGHVFLYSADYHYQAGRQFRHGQFVGNSARLDFQAVPGTGTTPAMGKGNGGVAKTNNVPPIDACIDWYDANTGDFIVRTGHCDDFGGGAGDVPHVYTGGGGPGGIPTGPSGYGGHGPSGSTQVGDTSDGIAADGPLSVGDYSKDCKVSFINGVTDIHVLVEATVNQNPPKIEKLTLTASGGVADAVKQVGDGTGHYDVVNNAFIFTVYYQVNGSVASSRLERVVGVLYLNTGRYVLRRFSN